MTTPLWLRDIDLDIWLAEHLLGEPVCREQCQWPDTLNGVPNAYPHRHQNRDHKKYWTTAFEDVSRDARGMLRVLEAMRERGTPLLIDTTYDGKEWHVSYGMNINCGENEFIVTDTALPRAVAEVAKAVIEHERRT